MTDLTRKNVRPRRSFFSWVGDWFHPSERILIEWTPGAGVRPFDTLPAFEPNITVSFAIVGPPGFCDAVIRVLQFHGVIRDRRSSHPSMAFWNQPPPGSSKISSH